MGYSPQGRKELETTERLHFHFQQGFPGGTSGKEPACQCRRVETWFQSLGQEDPLEEGVTVHFSILAWRIPWTEEPGGQQSTGLQRARQD